MWVLYLYSFLFWWFIPFLFPKCQLLNNTTAHYSAPPWPQTYNSKFSPHKIPKSNKQIIYYASYNSVCSIAISTSILTTNMIYLNIISEIIYRLRIKIENSQELSSPRFFRFTCRRSQLLLKAMTALSQYSELAGQSGQWPWAGVSELLSQKSS